MPISGPRSSLEAGFCEIATVGPEMGFCEIATVGPEIGLYQMELSDTPEIRSLSRALIEVRRTRYHSVPFGYSPGNRCL